MKYKQLLHCKLKGFKSTLSVFSTYYKCFAIIVAHVCHDSGKALTAKWHTFATPVSKHKHRIVKGYKI